MSPVEKHLSQIATPMFKKLPTLAKYLLSALVITVFLAPQAHAEGWFTIGSLSGQFVYQGLAYLSQAGLFLMSYWVSFTSILFSVSINLNLHIKQFVDQTEGVYLVWQTIRDVCSFFVIYMLLFTSIKLILNQEKGLGGVSAWIKDIVVAGILINFSFFITSVAIDASNTVSLALYKGIVGGQVTTVETSTKTGKIGVTEMVNSMLESNGVKDVSLGDFFLNKLSPQSIYQLQLSKPGDTAVPDPLRIFIQGVVGVIIMFTTGMSLLFAAIAFSARLIILIILLGFSAIWFAGKMFPGDIKKKSAEFQGYLIGQLLFMPVYLILLYAALLVLNHSTIFTSPIDHAGGSWVANYAVLAINDFFIIFLLNLPLVTALGFAGSAMSWLKTDKFSAEKVWGNIGKWTKSRAQGAASGAWRNTGGLAASRINNSAGMRNFYAKNPNLGRVVNNNLGKVGGEYNKRVETQKKAQEKLNKHIGTVDRSSYKTKPAYDAAVTSAKKAQEMHRDKLGGRTSIMTFFMRDRGNLQAMHGLNKTADKIASKEALGKNKKLKAETKDKLDELKARIERERNPAGFQPGKEPSAEDLKDLEKYKKEIEDLDEKIEKGEEEKENEKNEAIIEGINKANKDKSPKEDKPKEK
jgi:hypothetical protein